MWWLHLKFWMHVNNIDKDNSQERIVEQRAMKVRKTTMEEEWYAVQLSILKAAWTRGNERTSEYCIIHGSLTLSTVRDEY